METSYNGWTASPNPKDFGGLEPLVIAGESFAPGVRAGDVRVVLQYVFEQMHLRVEPVVKADWHQADDWGYYYRPNRNNPNEISCHGSGTAGDYNATRHPNGKKDTFTPAQVKEIRKILSEVDDVVRWGGDFKNPDEMHFEIIKNFIAVRAVANRLRGATNKKEDDLPLSQEDIDKIADAVWRKAQQNGFGDHVGPIQILNGVETRLKDVQDKVNQK